MKTTTTPAADEAAAPATSTQTARVRVLINRTEIGDHLFAAGHEMDLPLVEAEFREKRDEVKILSLN